MSMLVRKGTMLHRASTRRHSRRNSTVIRGPGGRERSASVGPMSSSTLSASGQSSSPVSSASPDRRFSRATIAGAPSTSFLTSSAVSGGGGNVDDGGKHLLGQHQKSGQSSSTSLVAQQGEPRRTSSIHSHTSTSDRKTLVAKAGSYRDAEAGGMTSYGSISYQLKDASEEASGLCDFVYRALGIIGKTAVVTIFLVCCMLLSFLMVVFGVQYMRECPKEQNIPIYLLVGGCFGILKIACLMWHQAKSRRYERLDDAFNDGDLEDVSTSASSQITDHALSLFLLIWFGMGNYWVLIIYRPRYKPLLLEPNNWCHEKVYTFTIVQILICYSIMAVFFLLIIILSIYHKIRNQ